MKEKRKLFIRNGDSMVVVPMSEDTYQLLRWKATASHSTISDVARGVLIPICFDDDKPWSTESLKAIARKDMRDVRGFADYRIQMNVRVKGSEFLKMGLSLQKEYLKWAQANIRLQPTSIINFIGAVTGVCELSTLATPGMRKAVQNHLS